MESYKNNHCENNDALPASGARRRVALFGATGSIGTTALGIIEANSDKLSPVFLSCHSRVDILRSHLERLAAAGRISDVEAVCVGSESDAAVIANAFPRKLGEIYIGAEGLVKAARELDYDVMLNALVGIAGLAPTCAALENGARKRAARGGDANVPRFEIALANKETLVAGGGLVMDAAREAGVPVVPVDSEHSAIFQCLAGNAGNKPRRVIVTASGGPFLGMTRGELADVTPEQALAHPNWSMGPKITVDSATMMNKAFELIEAKWLFGLPGENIEAIIHPGSVVHSLVEFEDGAMLAQLGVPSMKVPISYALSYPGRWPTDAGFVDLAALGQLKFAQPSGEGKRALAVAKRVIRESEIHGTDSGAIAINAANEILVAAFLAGRIAFTDILDGVEQALERAEARAAKTLDGIMEIDRETRKRTESFITCL
ncbi:MAG: 1-deoxy-D-xylulose-5-phosphate reductoisomerase [Clostridiales Family XIII bacterium]|jgi:1-deoxy-D-xylulose-5-phosphate reductoisomerase|nr:1-deoxy-D-xylulose-5-phosphate reductoisomerase [Clostridiales Family XIII bacterium]